MDSVIIWGVIFGAAVSFWAHKRGYAWWAFVLGSPIICAIALGILPNLKDPKQEVENAEEKRKQGNNTGLIISGLSLAVQMIIGAIK
jgi:hypothetical protein